MPSAPLPLFQDEAGICILSQHGFQVRHGFQRRDTLIAFLTESLVLALAGGLAGLVFASFMQFLSFSTTNFQSFSELVFGFTLSFAIVAKSLVFVLVMGLLGGFLPAFRAARMKIVDSLRAA